MVDINLLNSFIFENYKKMGTAKGMIYLIIATILFFITLFVAFPINNILGWLCAIITGFLFIKGLSQGK